MGWVGRSGCKIIHVEGSVGDGLRSTHINAYSVQSTVPYSTYVRRPVMCTCTDHKVYLVRCTHRPQLAFGRLDSRNL